MRRPSELPLMQPARWSVVACLAAVVAAAAPVAATAPDLSDPGELVMTLREVAQRAAEDPVAAAEDPQGLVDPVLNPEEEGTAQPGAPVETKDPAFADRIRDAFEDELLVAGIATAVASLLGLAGFAFVTRYISPKEALRNPQRAMLYGFVRGHPGVHLKKLSEEFAMKTSSILWHVRKLEGAELVRSERANGYRVFYPVEGGIEIRKVSRAITALQNGNARVLFEAVERRPGASPSELATALHIHAGTIRWHLRKLREFGLVDELPDGATSKLFPTPLGKRALQTLLGAPVDRAPVPTTAWVPVAAE